MSAARILLWVASLGGLALCARSLLVEPIPLWVAGSALVAYVALATVGVLVPRLEMYGDVFWKGDPGKKGVALTFDDGPHPRTTRRILEILAQREAPATFFVIGKKARLYADVIREIHDAGHTLGLHGYEHDRLYSFKTPAYVRADIERTQKAIEEACSVRPTWFRPPIGHVSTRTVAGAKHAGVELVAWSVRGLDGLATADPDAVARRVEKGLRDGAIVLLHDAAEREDHEPASVEALPRILEAIEKKGLRVVPLGELMDAEEGAS